ncbi:MAG: CaiB/BaiF CoA-transferase family protein [Gemmatimonadota bacterium]|jgi:crotonobetainyl-CoA:carnitine CoA-transferase CaiB-like acyl-CoA transferase
MSALQGMRVVELAHERCALAGKLLGDMGADVVVVEPVCGSPTRSHEPFVDDVPDPERSLTWWHYNTSKRGIALDWTRPEGREVLLELIARADLLLEAEDPGVLADHGLDAAVLTDALPRLVHVSLTPFGPTGARSCELATDLTILAGGGPAWNCGYDDHELPPIRGAGGHGYAIGCHYAALAALTALVHRELGGRGQRIDVSMHAAANVTTEMASYNWLVAKGTVKRQTGRHASEGPSMPSQQRCADGRYVNTGVPPRTPKEYENLLRWLRELGLESELPETIFLEMGAQKDDIDLSKIGSDDEITAIFGAGRAALTLIASRVGAREFFLGAQRAGLPVGVIYSPEEAFEDEHFVARGFQVEVEQPQLGRSVRYPGAPYAFEKSRWAISRPAPRLGEHTDEVLAEAGIDPSPLRDAGIIHSMA